MVMHDRLIWLTRSHRCDTVPQLSRAAQEFVDACGGWLDYCQLFEFDPTLPAQVEEARQHAEYAADHEYIQHLATARV